MSKTQTMTPERETWEILTTFHRMTQDERDEACTRIARAFKAEAALPDLLAVCRKAAELRKRWQDDDEYGTVDYVDDLRDLHPDIVAAIANAEGGGKDLCWSKVETQPLGSEYGWRCDGIAPCPPDPRAKAEGGAA